MTATLLTTHRVEKPWGRHTLWPGFANPPADGEAIGEVWFQTPDSTAPDLLVKYLFTSQKLSIQIHPDDAQAHAHGHKRGKDEAWLILAADPDATIGLGTVRPLSKDELRAASLDGSIDGLLDWKPVKAGDFIYSPARTVHAIGPGLTVIEIQQNVDLTYRFYDYGRPRETHLDLAVEVADARPFEFLPKPVSDDPNRVILAEGPKFVVERRKGGKWSLELGDLAAWFVPIAGRGTVDGVAWEAGQCLSVNDRVDVVASDDADVLLTYPGDRRV